MDPSCVFALQVGSYNLDVRPMADCDKIRPRLLKPPEIVHFTGWLMMSVMREDCLDVGVEDDEMVEVDVDVDVFYTCLDVDWWWLLMMGFET